MYFRLALSIAVGTLLGGCLTITAPTIDASNLVVPTELLGTFQKTDYSGSGKVETVEISDEGGGYLGAKRGKSTDSFRLIKYPSVYDSYLVLKGERTAKDVALGTLTNNGNGDWEFDQIDVYPNKTETFAQAAAQAGLSFKPSQGEYSSNELHGNTNATTLLAFLGASILDENLGYRRTAHLVKIGDAPKAEAPASGANSYQELCKRFTENLAEYKKQKETLCQASDQTCQFDLLEVGGAIISGGYLCETFLGYGADLPKDEWESTIEILVQDQEKMVHLIGEFETKHHVKF